jgi:hypothetical protein
MTDNDSEVLLYRILSGKTIFHYNNERYVLYAPSLEIKYEASLIFDNIINEEKYHDWIREEYATNIMMSLGLWNMHTDRALKDLNKQLDNLKVDLFSNFMVPSKTKQIRQKIKNTKESIGKINFTKQNFLSNTLEGYAGSIKNEYIICNTLYKNDKLVFGYDNDYKSYTLFNSLVQHIDSLIITTELFKKLARSDTWRAYWNSCKHNDLFGSSVIELTDEQRALINISKMYDNIYEHPECPEDNIIDDDDALDGWMILQKRKNDKHKKQAAFNESNKNLKNAGEVFLFAENENDVESITEMNDYEAKIALKQKMSYISSKGGEIEDGELPDVQMDIQRAISELKKNKR